MTTKANDRLKRAAQYAYDKGWMPKTLKPEDRFILRTGEIVLLKDVSNADLQTNQTFLWVPTYDEVARLFQKNHNTKVACNKLAEGLWLVQAEEQEGAGTSPDEATWSLLERLAGVDQRSEPEPHPS